MEPQQKRDGWKARYPDLRRVGIRIITMITGIGIFFAIAGFGSLCWLFFDLFVYTLPIMVGGAAGVAAHYTGAGVLGAFFVGVVVAIITLVVGRTAIATSQSPVIRMVVTLLFVIPAAWAGYSGTLDFVRWLEVPSVVWQQIYALFGAFMVGGAAFTRLTDPNLFESGRTMTEL